MTKPVKVIAKGVYDYGEGVCNFDLNEEQFAYYVHLGFYDDSLVEPDNVIDISNFDGFSYDTDPAGKDGKEYEHYLTQSGVPNIRSQNELKEAYSTTFWVSYTDKDLGQYQLCAYNVNYSEATDDISNCNSQTDQEAVARNLYILNGDYEFDVDISSYTTEEDEVCDSGGDCSDDYITDLGNDRDFETQVNHIKNELTIYEPMPTKANSFRAYYPEVPIVESVYAACQNYNGSNDCTDANDDDSEDNVHLYTLIRGAADGDGEAVMLAENDDGNDDGHQIRIESPLNEPSGLEAGYFGLAMTKYDFDDESYTIKEPNHDSNCSGGDYTLDSGKLTDDYGNIFKITYVFTGDDDEGCIDMTKETLTNLDD